MGRVCVDCQSATIDGSAVCHAADNEQPQHIVCLTHKDHVSWIYSSSRRHLCPLRDETGLKSIPQPASEGGIDLSAISRRRHGQDINKSQPNDHQKPSTACQQPLALALIYSLSQSVSQSSSISPSSPDSDDSADDDSSPLHTNIHDHTASQPAAHTNRERGEMRRETKKRSVRLVDG